MRRILPLLGLTLAVVAGAETIDGSRLTVVNAPIARARLGISNDWVIALGTNSVRIAAGANVTVTTNVTATNVIYTIASSGGGGGSNSLAFLTNGVVVSSTVTQINVANVNGLRWDVANSSGALTLTPFRTNAFGLVWTNTGGDNVSQTNNVVFTPLITTNITGNSDGLTVVEPGSYFVSAQVSYALTGNDTLTVVLTTNNTDYTPSQVRTFFNTTSGGAPTFTNFVATTAVIRLAATDRIRFKRWYGNGAGNLFRQLDASMSAQRIGDY